MELKVAAFHHPNCQPSSKWVPLSNQRRIRQQMSAAFHILCLRYSKTRLWETFSTVVGFRTLIKQIAHAINIILFACIRVHL